MEPLDEIPAVVSAIVGKYWTGYAPHIVHNYVQRHVFEIQLLQQALGEIKGKSVVDVGGGWGAFAASCSALGMKAVLLDDFGDPGNQQGRDPRRSLTGDYGVDVKVRDVIRDGLGLPAESVDAITSFDVIEHLHGSPREFLHDAVRVLRPGGVLLLGAPNCVNLRKRIAVPLGRGKWSDFSTWYDNAAFRGHVREPDVEDLRRIAEDIRLRDYQILGRNWAGYDVPNKNVRTAVRIADLMLRYFPSLCSSLYLLGWRRGGTNAYQPVYTRDPNDEAV